MSHPFAGMAAEPFISINRELDFAQAPGPFAEAEDLLLVSDLAWVDVDVKRWHKDGSPLRLRVRALDFDQQEKIDRASMVKLPDGRAVKSEARFAAATLKEACIMPQLSDAQARQMQKHNPAIMAAITNLVWHILSVFSQADIDALVIQSIPNAAEPSSDAQPDGIAPGESDDDSDPQDPYGFTGSGDPAYAEVAP